MPPTFLNRCAALGFGCLLLSGCAMESTAPPSISLVDAAIQGKAHGGQQPVVGSHVYLFAAGTSGYGGASTSLLTANTAGMDTLGSYVLTDSTGSFSISSGNTCVSGTQLYLLATQGNPGLPVTMQNPSPNNASLAMMAALGQCPASGSLSTLAPYVWINEVTTVASVWALAGFMTDLTHVSSSGTALAQVGIANAFVTAGRLMNLATGTAALDTPLLGGVADILAACVNSDGTVTGPTNPTSCYTLFTNAINGTTQATDTVTAAVNMAHNPATNVAALNGLQAGAGAPFQSYEPGSFLMELSYVLPITEHPYSIVQPDGLAVDAEGNIWVSGMFNSGTASVGGLYIFSNQGALKTGNLVGDGTVGVSAIDLSGDAWLVGCSPFKINDSGTQLASYSDCANTHLAVDAFGNVWIPGTVSAPNGLIEINGMTGSLISPSTGYVGGGLNHPMSIALDASGNVWIANEYSGVSEFKAATGVPVSSTAYTGGGLSNTVCMAIDHTGNVWIVSSALAGVLTELNGATGAPISPSAGYTGGGLSVSFPFGIAIDGVGDVWVAAGTNSGGLLIEYSNAGQAISPGTGFLSSTDTGYYSGVAVDGSGNVWFTAAGDTLNEIVGGAAPVVTPLAAGVAYNELGARP